MAISVAGAAFADLMGGLLGFAIGRDVGHSGWDLVGDVVIGAAVVSCGVALKVSTVRSVESDQ